MATAKQQTIELPGWAGFIDRLLMRGVGTAIAILMLVGIYKLSLETFVPMMNAHTELIKQCRISQ